MCLSIKIWSKITIPMKMKKEKKKETLIKTGRMMTKRRTKWMRGRKMMMPRKLMRMRKTRMKNRTFP